MTILFLGSGPMGIPTLERLHQLRPGRVVVGTVPNAPRGRNRAPAPTPVKVCADNLGIQCHEVPTLKGKAGSTLLGDSGADLVIVCDFRLFLSTKFLTSPRCGCYNLHPSMLPRYRGAAPVARAVLNGDLDHGITLYEMVKEMDAGPIVAQLHRPQRTKRSRLDLEEQLSREAAVLLGEWLPTLEVGEAPSSPQDESQVTFAPRLDKQESWLSWAQSADHIENAVLGLWPWPGARTKLQNKPGEAPLPLLIHAVLPATDQAPSLSASPPSAVPGTGSGTSGTVLGASGEGVEVACGPGGTDVVRLTVLQKPGKRPLLVGEFLRGTKIEMGARLLGPEAA